MCVSIIQCLLGFFILLVCSSGQSTVYCGESWFTVFSTWIIFSSFSKFYLVLFVVGLFHSLGLCSPAWLLSLSCSFVGHASEGMGTLSVVNGKMKVN